MEALARPADGRPLPVGDPADRPLLRGAGRGGGVAVWPSVHGQRHLEGPCAGSARAPGPAGPAARRGGEESQAGRGSRPRRKAWSRRLKRWQEPRRAGPRHPAAAAGDDDGADWARGSPSGKCRQSCFRTLRHGRQRRRGPTDPRARAGQQPGGGLRRAAKAWRRRRGTGGRAGAGGGRAPGAAAGAGQHGPRCQPAREHRRAELQRPPPPRAATAAAAPTWRAEQRSPSRGAGPAGPPTRGWSAEDGPGRPAPGRPGGSNGRGLPGDARPARADPRPGGSALWGAGAGGGAQRPGQTGTRQRSPPRRRRPRGRRLRGHFGRTLALAALRPGLRPAAGGVVLAGLAARPGQGARLVPSPTWPSRWPRRGSGWC